MDSNVYLTHLTKIYFPSFSCKTKDCFNLLINGSFYQSSLYIMYTYTFFSMEILEAPLFFKKKML